MKISFGGVYQDTKGKKYRLSGDAISYVDKKTKMYILAELDTEMRHNIYVVPSNVFDDDKSFKFLYNM